MRFLLSLYIFASLICTQLHLNTHQLDSSHNDCSICTTLGHQHIISPTPFAFQIPAILQWKEPLALFSRWIIEPTGPFSPRGPPQIYSSKVI